MHRAWHGDQRSTATQACVAIEDPRIKEIASSIACELRVRWERDGLSLGCPPICEHAIANARYQRVPSAGLRRAVRSGTDRSHARASAPMGFRSSGSLTAGKESRPRRARQSPRGGRGACESCVLAQKQERCVPRRTERALAVVFCSGSSQRWPLISPLITVRL